MLLYSNMVLAYTILFVTNSSMDRWTPIVKTLNSLFLLAPLWCNLFTLQFLFLSFTLTIIFGVVMFLLSNVAWLFSRQNSIYTMRLEQVATKVSDEIRSLTGLYRIFFSMVRCADLISRLTCHTVKFIIGLYLLYISIKTQNCTFIIHILATLDVLKSY